MSSVPIMVSDGRRVCGRKWGREDKSGGAERDSRNSKSAKSHGNSLSGWAAQERPLEAPRWNFHKYLIGRDGRLTGAFTSAVEPNDPKLVAAIERELNDA